MQFGGVNLVSVGSGARQLATFRRLNSPSVNLVIGSTPGRTDRVVNYFTSPAKAVRLIITDAALAISYSVGAALCVLGIGDGFGYAMRLSRCASNSMLMACSPRSCVEVSRLTASMRNCFHASGGR